MNLSELSYLSLKSEYNNNNESTWIKSIQLWTDPKHDLEFPINLGNAGTGQIA